MASVLKVDKLDPQSGTALEIGTSGDTVSIPSGATLDISASTLTPPATMPASSGINFTALNATNLGSGTVPTARLGTGTASSSTVLYGDQTYKAEPGGVNTPAFFAYKNATQTGVVKNTATKISFQTEVFDSDGDYDNSSNYRFTPTTAGKYLVTASLSAKGNVSTTTFICWLFKNGAAYARDNNYASTSQCMSTITTMVDMDGSSDYLEVYIYQGTTGDIEIYSGTEYTWFGAMKIIGA